MSKRTMLVSDFSGKEISEKDGYSIILKPFDSRRGIYVADLHVDDDIVAQMKEHGRSQSRRGRKPKTAEESQQSQAESKPTRKAKATSSA